MKYKAIIFLSLVLLNCKFNSDQSKAYSIDIKTTANALTLFGENIISTSMYERDLAISPQGHELIYTLGDYKQNKRCLVVLNQSNGHWTNAEILNISENVSRTHLSRGKAKLLELLKINKNGTGH